MSGSGIWRGGDLILPALLGSNRGPLFLVSVASHFLGVRASMFGILVQKCKTHRKTWDPVRSPIDKPVEGQN